MNKSFKIAVTKDEVTFELIDLMDPNNVLKNPHTMNVSYKTGTGFVMIGDITYMLYKVKFKDSSIRLKRQYFVDSDMRSTLKLFVLSSYKENNRKILINGDNLILEMNPHIEDKNKCIDIKLYDTTHVNHASEYREFGRVLAHYVLPKLNYDIHSNGSITAMYMNNQAMAQEDKLAWIDYMLKTNYPDKY